MNMYNKLIIPELLLDAKILECFSKLQPKPSNTLLLFVIENTKNTRDLFSSDEKIILKNCIVHNADEYFTTDIEVLKVEDTLNDSIKVSALYYINDSVVTCKTKEHCLEVSELNARIEKLQKEIKLGN